MPRTETLHSKKAIQSILEQQENIEEVNPADLQLFVNIYLEEVSNVEHNYTKMYENANKEIMLIKR